MTIGSVGDVVVAEEHSRHRMKLPLYDLEPRTENNWIAPSATVIGEVILRRFATVWYNERCDSWRHQARRGRPLL